MVIREPVQTLDLDTDVHTWVSRIKSVGRGTGTREKQEAGMRTVCHPEVFWVLLTGTRARVGGGGEKGGWGRTGD